jgi:hypothetical protein
MNVDADNNARNMVFDHDAILLDNAGAATPEQGVGINVNSEQVEVFNVNLDDDEQDDLEPEEELSFTDKVKSIVKNMLGSQKLDTEFSQSHNEQEQINFNQNEGDAMRETLLKALADKKIDVNADISDADLLLKYNESIQDSEKLDAVVNTVASLADSVKSIQSTLTANADAEKALALKANEAFAEKHGLDLADVESMSVNAKAKLDKTKSGTFGINGEYQNNNQVEDESSLTMPE